MSNYTTPIMVAPNGARLTQTDHPGVPVTIEQTIDCAVECRKAGAHALHAHVRDEQQKHLLDASQYQALLDMAANRLGSDFPVQITTEAFGIYSAEEQMELVRTLKPRYTSIAMREMLRDEAHVNQATQFYRWCVEAGIAVQHIVYGADDFHAFQTYQSQGVIPTEHQAVLMVVGRYTDSKVADTQEAASLISTLAASNYHWMLCAFGKTETDCLVQTAHAGGGLRVGFENNHEQVDGGVANSNAERVSALYDALGTANNLPIDTRQLHRMLGGV